MAEIYNFNNNNNEEESCCPFCELAKDYVQMIKYAENDEQLFELVREVISIAGDLTLIDYLQNEISSSARLLDYLKYGEHDCEDE
jgi:hypothetical protein